MKHLLKSFLAVAVALMLVACGEDNSYLKILPDDVSLLARLDVKNIVKKSGVADNEDFKDLRQEMIDQLDRKCDLTKQELERVEKIFDDPTQSGLDLRKAVFAFGPSEKFPYAGIVAAVKDEDALKEMLNIALKQTDERLRERDEYSYYCDDALRPSIMLLTDKTFIVAVATEKDCDAVRDLTKRLDAEDKGVTETESFKQLCDAKKDFAITFRLDAFEPYMSRYEREQYEKIFEQAEVEPKHVQVMSTLHIEKASVEASIKVFSEDEKTQKALTKYYDQVKTVTAKGYEYLPADCLAGMCAGLMGKAAWEQLSGMKEWKEVWKQASDQMPEQAAAAERIVKGLNGEFTLGCLMPDAEEGGANSPKILALADYEGPVADFTNLAEFGVENFGTKGQWGWDDDFNYTYQEKTVMEKVAAGVYRYDVESWRSQPCWMYFGVVGGQFFLSTIPDYTAPKKPAASLDQKQFSLMKGAIVHGFVNFPAAWQHPKAKENLRDLGIYQGISHVGMLEMAATADKTGVSFTAQLAINDLEGDETPLSLLISTAVRAVKKQMR